MTTSSSATRCSGRAAMPPSCASTRGRRRWRSPPTSRRAIARPIRMKAASRRWRKPGVTSAPSARVRWRSPTTSISAIRNGPRSWASWSAAFAASARRRARSTSRSCPATSRSTTRPTAAPSCRRRPSAASACSTIFTRSATIAFKAEGEAILLIGETRGWLGQSLYLREICGREEGAPPPVDLAAERRHGDFVRALIHDGLVTAVHDVSDGGLLVALAEMAMVSHIGAVLEAPEGVLAPCILVWRGSGPLRADGERC